MAKIRNKVWKIEGGIPVQRTIDDNDSIVDVRAGADFLEKINVVPFQSPVVTETLFDLVKDLLHNDAALNDEQVATSEIVSEGVLDISRSTLTISEEEDYDALKIKETDLTISPEEEIELATLIKRKYWCNFLIDVTVPATETEEPVVTIGPGKIKVYDIDFESDSTYFVRNQNVDDGITSVNLITEDDYYRRDLVSVVFRDEGGEVTPYIKYVHGTENATINPKHTIMDKVLTEDYGSYPLWSILFQKNSVSGKTTAVKIDRVFQWAGIKSIVLYEQAKPYRRDENDGAGFSYTIHSHDEIQLRKLNGEYLTPEFGESADTGGGGTIIGPVEDAGDVGEIVFNQLPLTITPLSNDAGSGMYFPFVWTELYNEYINYQIMELNKFTLGFDNSNVAVLEEGAELNIYTAKKYASEGNVSEFDIDEYIDDYDGTGACKIVFSDEDVSISAVPLSGLVQLTEYAGEGNFEDAPNTPQINDFFVITNEPGIHQIGTIHNLGIAAGKTYIIAKTLEIDLNSSSKITIFNSQSEELVGFELNETSVLEYPQTIRDAYIDTYNWEDPTGSQHTGRSILTTDELKAEIENDDWVFPGENTVATKVNFSFKLNIHINQFYFAKVNVKSKAGNAPSYGETAKMLLKEVGGVIAERPFFSSEFGRIPGKYPGTADDGTGIIFFQILHKVIDGLNTSYEDIESQSAEAIAYRTLLGLPKYWKPIAKNLDSAAFAFPDALSEVDRLDGDPGIVYVDTLSGKFVFADGEDPFNDVDNEPNILVTYAIDNVVNGRLDTEGITHFVNPLSTEARTITLRSKLEEIDEAIENINLEENKVFYRLAKPGFLSGGALSIIDSGNKVKIEPFRVAITKDSKLYNIDVDDDGGDLTSSISDLAGDYDKIYLILFYEEGAGEFNLSFKWEDQTYYDNSLVPGDEIVIGKFVNNGSVFTEIDLNFRTMGLFDDDYNVVIDGDKKLFVNTIEEKDADTGVTIDGVKFIDNDVEAVEVRTDTINEETGSGAGVTVAGVKLIDNDVEADEVRTDTINEETGSGAGVTVAGVKLIENDVEADEVRASHATIDDELIAGNMETNLVETNELSDKSGGEILLNNPFVDSDGDGIAGFLDDGTAFYKFYQNITIAAANTGISVNHNKPIGTVLTCSGVHYSAYYDTVTTWENADSSGSNRIVRIECSNTNIYLKRMSSGSTQVFRVCVEYIK